MSPCSSLWCKGGLWNLTPDLPPRFQEHSISFMRMSLAFCYRLTTTIIFEERYLGIFVVKLKVLGFLSEGFC